MDIDEIRLREIELFLGLVKIKSVRELGRQTGIPAGQVSKWIQALEKKLGVALIERSATGIQPTPGALELLPVFEKMHQLRERLGQRGEQKPRERMFSFASSSFFSTHLMPLLSAELEDKSKSDHRLKIIDLPPTSFIPAALRGAFEFCLHSQQLDWPRTWTTKEIGELGFQLYARKKHPVLKEPHLKNILQYPFVVPVYWTPDGARYGDDQCPVPFAKRLKGHETATAASACELIKHSHQLAFLPELVARQSVSRGEIQEVQGPWKAVRRKVFLTVKSATVKQSDFELIHSACERILRSL